MSAQSLYLLYFLDCSYFKKLVGQFAKLAFSTNLFTKTKKSFDIQRLEHGHMVGYNEMGANQLSHSCRWEGFNCIKSALTFIM